MVTPLPESLRTLAGTRYGPVAFHTADDALTATFDDTLAQVLPDAGALLVRATASCPAPPDADVARRVALAMAEVSATRVDLCTLAADGTSVTASLWVPPDAGAPGLATAARGAVLLARFGAEVVDAVLRDEATAAAYRRAEAGASRAADEAERALQRLLAGQQRFVGGGPPAPPPGPGTHLTGPNPPPAGAAVPGLRPSAPPPPPPPPPPGR